MSNLRRYFAPNRTYFITSVTYNRIDILHNRENQLIESFQGTADKLSIDLIAWVVLRDHFHIIITQDSVDPADYLKRAKLSFSQKVRYHEKYIGRIWQLRYWDHVIRDMDDFRAHLDYIHFNPVKHGYTNNPHIYKYSTLSLFDEEGYYEQDWGVNEKLTFSCEFGEY